MFLVIQLYPQKIDISCKYGERKIGKSQNIMELIVEVQNILTESLILLTGSVLRSSVFEHNTRYFKQLQGRTIGNKFAPPYTILFMGFLEDKVLNYFVEKPLVWWSLHL